MSILLQSWNLLTRTSQSFEFVNIRLTVIWIIGFIFRYCVLLPGRILILGVGVSTNLKYSFLKLRYTFEVLHDIDMFIINFYPVSCAI